MAEKARTMAKHSGMGAIPNAKGVTFRVWAPHAEKVYLIGAFNGWSETLLTSPGVPMLFQGQELLEDRWFQDKVPIDWTRIEDESGILKMYLDLIALRRNLLGDERVVRTKLPNLSC